VSDTIASRVTRVIGVSVHALLDAVESVAPEAAMAQAIREVDQAADEVRAELGRVEAVKHLAGSSLNKLNTRNEALAGQVEIAVAKGEENLARAGIAKQVDIEDQIPVLQQSLQDAVDRGKELEGYIAALLAKRREMESVLRDFIAARNTSQGSPTAGSPNGSPDGKVERAEATFDRLVARHAGVAGATSPINPDAAKLAELQELARAHRIDERLAALKAAQANRR
jgi:phage shock protein A